MLSSILLLILTIILITSLPLVTAAPRLPVQKYIIEDDTDYEVAEANALPTLVVVKPALEYAEILKARRRASKTNIRQKPQRILRVQARVPPLYPYPSSASNGQYPSTIYAYHQQPQNFYALESIPTTLQKPIQRHQPPQRQQQQFYPPRQSTTVYELVDDYPYEGQAQQRYQGVQQHQSGASTPWNPPNQAYPHQNYQNSQQNVQLLQNGVSGAVYNHQQQNLPPMNSASNNYFNALPTTTTATTGVWSPMHQHDSQRLPPNLRMENGRLVSDYGPNHKAIYTPSQTSINEDFNFAANTPGLGCLYLAPVPLYNTPRKKCVPYHPQCGFTFTCVMDVNVVPINEMKSFDNVKFKGDYIGHGLNRISGKIAKF